MWQRVVDIVLASIGLITLSPIMFFVLIVCWFDTGSPLFFQERIGQHQRPFKLAKFRTMHTSTPSIATHLVKPSCISSYGSFLRKSKLDELPQLVNVIKGEMSIVGPRPGLANQLELTEARQKYNVFASLPGITGLAQISNIDMSDPENLAKVDAEMIKTFSFAAYLKYIILTISGKGKGDQIQGR